MMRVGGVVLTAVLLFLGAADAELEAKTHRVPEDFDDMWQALAEATYGDTVLVSPGKYRVRTRIRSGVKLISAEGPDSTILWNRRRIILQMSDCDMETEVSGFTFEGVGCTAALACTLGAPVITGNVIIGPWDGINLYQCNALIQGNTVRDCRRGIHITDSDAQLIENSLSENGYGVSMITAAPVIARCRFEHNTTGILILGHSYPVIGGSLTTANDILMNKTTISNNGLRIEDRTLTSQPEIAVATYNYWGSDCPVTRVAGEVITTPWTNAAHDTVFYTCPEAPASDEEVAE